MQSPSSGYYAYNWFYNNTTGSGTQPPASTPPPGYSGFPTFSIVSVVMDKNVTIQTKNLNPNDTFRVTMGPMGTQGIGGIVVDVVDSGTGGSKKYTFDIPAALYGSYKISIRMQSPTSVYYAYNWFYNNTTGGATQPPAPSPSPTPPPGYTGIPTFKILSVVRDSSVKIQTYNLPPNDSFVVTMGPMGTQGIGGIKVDTVDTGAGGSKAYTFSIPASLYGSYKISIRMQSPTSGYYAYNWFYNNTVGSP
jgi:outer membrane lipoprotein SlyB